jgi:hypothetical protein
VVKIPATFLEERSEGEERICAFIQSRFSQEISPKEGFTIFMDEVLISRENRETLYSPCLGVSSEAGGESPLAAGCGSASQRETPYFF